MGCNPVNPYLGVSPTEINRATDMHRITLQVTYSRCQALSAMGVGGRDRLLGFFIL